MNEMQTITRKTRSGNTHYQATPGVQPKKQSALTEVPLNKETKTPQQKYLERTPEPDKAWDGITQQPYDITMMHLARIEAKLDMLIAGVKQPTMPPTETEELFNGLTRAQIADSRRQGSMIWRRDDQGYPVLVLPDQTWKNVNWHSTEQQDVDEQVEAQRQANEYEEWKQSEAQSAVKTDRRALMSAPQ